MWKEIGWNGGENDLRARNFKYRIQYLFLLQC